MQKLCVFHEKVWRERKKVQNYIYTANRLCDILKVKGDFEEALKIGIPTLEMIENGQGGDMRDKMNILFLVGQCQIYLNQFSESKETLEKAYELCLDAIKNDSTNMSTLNTIENTYNTSENYMKTQQYQEAEIWLGHCQLALDQYTGDGPVPSDYLRAVVLILKAELYEREGKHAEASEAYADYQKTGYGQTSEGKLAGANYLMKAGRWGQAADNFVYVDTLFNVRDMSMSLDNIQEWLLPQLRANIYAKRDKKAFDLSLTLCDQLDSAITSNKKDNAAELSTVYETQKKDAEIAKQQIEISQQKLVGLGAALVLLTLFFIVYTLYRRRLARMQAAHERIESELRIAREIQMSMVPSEFPEREGLDMYATMTPAKEVGGDLYGYLLEEDQLYFAVGDVSGKGVPASLFMAQATRLFTTLAKQGMQPAEICTRMNDALSGVDNVNGMFVTLFSGLIDLKTGHLSYCNAGHNPPVIGGNDTHGEFLEMIPNAPIGLWPGLEYEGEKIDNIQGKPLFIYTDGLNEAENREQVQLGDDRLLEILRSTRFKNARQMIDTLTAEVAKHRAGAEPNDDLTMMCIRVGTNYESLEFMIDKV